jgi:hypothetical protein
MEDHPGGDEVLLSATGMLISSSEGYIIKSTKDKLY